MMQHLPMKLRYVYFDFTCDNSSAGGSSLVDIRTFNADCISKSAGWAIRVRNQFRCLFTGRFEYNVIFPYCWKRRRLGDFSNGWSVWCWVIYLVQFFVR